MAMLVMLKAALPVLDSFTARAVLVVPTVRLPKVSEVGERLAAGVLEVTPDPVRLAVCGLPVALSVTETVAFLVPVAVRLNVTFPTRRSSDLTELPQLLV